MSEELTIERIRELRAEFAWSKSPWAKTPFPPEAIDFLLAKLDEMREKECWHCGVVLASVPKPRCESCPDECDEEGCDAYGCRRQRRSRRGALAQHHGTEGEKR